MVDRRSPLFLHSGWRTGSTWLWSRFRDLPGVCGYYEPFNEILSRCTAGRIQELTDAGWDSRHPQLGRPYFDEYAPLSAGNGIRGFKREFALADYFEVGGSAAQRRYLARLLGVAEAAGRWPVLGFCRSLGRVGWMKQRFGGCHAVSLRDPVQQWLSCSSYRRAGGDAKFELNHLAILALAPRDHPAGSLAKALGLPDLRRRKLTEVVETLRRQFAPLPDDLSYRAFVGVWLLGHLHALAHADLTLDMDRLAADEGYRGRAGTHLAAASGLPADLGGCRLPRHDPGELGLDFQAANDEAWAALAGSAPDLRPAARRLLAGKLRCEALLPADLDALLCRPGSRRGPWSGRLRIRRLLPALAPGEVPA